MCPKTIVCVDGNKEILCGDHVNFFGEGKTVDMYRRCCKYHNFAAYTLTRYRNNVSDRGMQYAVFIENLTTGEIVTVGCFRSDWEKHRDKVLSRMKDVSIRLFGRKGVREIRVPAMGVFTYDPDSGKIEEETLCLT